MGFKPMNLQELDMYDAHLPGNHIIYLSYTHIIYLTYGTQINLIYLSITHSFCPNKR